MARTLKAPADSQSQSQNTDTQSHDWTKAQRKAVRSFLKRAKAANITFTISMGDETITVGARELNSLLRTLGIMTAQQRDYLEGSIVLEELREKLDLSFSYWSNDEDDYSNAE